MENIFKNRPTSKKRYRTADIELERVAKISLG